MERIHAARMAYVLFAWGIVVALLAQVSLIGLWLFSGQPTLAIHKEFGHLIFLMVFALLILAFVGRLPSPMQLATAVLSVITAFQTEVFALLPGSPLRSSLVARPPWCGSVSSRQPSPYRPENPERTECVRYARREGLCPLLVQLEPDAVGILHEADDVLRAYLDGPGHRRPGFD